MILKWLKIVFGNGEVYCNNCQYLSSNHTICRHPSNLRQKKFKTWHDCGVVTVDTRCPSNKNYNNQCSDFKEKSK